MYKILISEKSVSSVLSMFILAGIGLSPVSAYASTIGLHGASAPAAVYGVPDDIADIELTPAFTNADMIILPAVGNPGNNFGRLDHVPPVNPPIDTPAFYNGLTNTPAIMPASVPSHTLPGSGFGQTVVPVPAAVWLFSSGLLGLIGIAKRKRA
jgi:hypothetical protein